MIKKCFVLGLTMVMGASVQAEPIRTVLTKENRLPGLYQAELGVEAYYMETDFADITSVIPYLRYTLLPDFAVFATLPYQSVDPMVGPRERGIGDVVAGVEFVAFQDVFGYPWIMPHAAVSFDTGDEDKGLGAGDTEYLVGVALGTTVNRVFHFIADARYRVVSDVDNIPSIATAVVWDLDDRFSLIGEMELSREKDDFDDTHPIIFMGGMHYKATSALSFALNGGTAKNSDMDVIMRARVSYSF